MESCLQLRTFTVSRIFNFTSSICVIYYLPATEIKDPLRFRYVQVSLNYEFNVLKPHKDQVLYSLYREPLGRLDYNLFME